MINQNFQQFLTCIHNKKLSKFAYNINWVIYIYSINWVTATVPPLVWELRSDSPRRDNYNFSKPLGKELITWTLSWLFQSPKSTLNCFKLKLKIIVIIRVKETMSSLLHFHEHHEQAMIMKCNNKQDVNVMCWKSSILVSRHLYIGDLISKVIPLAFH